MSIINEEYGKLDRSYYKWYLENLSNITCQEFSKKISNSSSIGLNIDDSTQPFMKWWAKEKAKYPRSVIAVQVGKFIEFRGIDSILACEFANLNMQGGKNMYMACGFNISSMQTKFDALVNHNLIIRVYKQFEQSEQIHLSKSKQRILSQVISSSNPVYYNSVKNIENIQNKTSTEIKPLFFYLHNKELYVIYIPSQTYVKYQHVNKECFRILFRSLNPTTVYTATCENNSDFDYIKKLDVVKRVFVSHSINLPDQVFEYVKSVYGLLGYVSFYQITKNISPMLKCTSDEIGLRSALKNVPDLIDYVLGKKAHPSQCKFMIDWLLLKPDMIDRDNVIYICDLIYNGKICIPRTKSLDPQRTFGFLNSESNYRDVNFLFILKQNLNNRVCDRALFEIAVKYTGLKMSYTKYKEEISKVEDIMKRTLDSKINSKQFEYIPIDLSSKEIYVIKSPDSEAMLNRQKIKLNELLHQFSKVKKNDKKFEFKDDSIFFYHKPDTTPVMFVLECGTKHKGIQITNNKRQIRKNFWTAQSIKISLDNYLKFCYHHNELQKKKIIDFCNILAKEFGVCIRLFLHTQNIAKCLYSHLTHVTSLGWNKANFTKDRNIEIKSMFPYWKSKHNSVKSSIKLFPGKIAFLTAPNGYGKTTFIRSITTSAVLAHSGLYVPSECAIFPSLDNFFIKLPGSDRPNEGLSSFASEVKDLSLICKNISSNSLVCVDEIMRSTCPDEGVCLAQAMMEYISSQNCYCIFSTHMFKLSEVKVKKELFTIDKNHNLLKGFITDSKAIDICVKYELPDYIIKRSCLLLKKKQHTVVGKKYTKKRKIQEISENVIGKNSRWIGTMCMIPPEYDKTHCVYIIHEDIDRDIFYCGETKHVSTRYEQHKQKRSGDIIIFSVANKTEAMRFETLIQKKCIEEDVRLSSYSDSYHVL